MSQRNFVSDHLRELGREFGLADFSLDSSNRASLLVEDMRLTYRYSDESGGLLWLYVDLGTVDSEDEAAMSFLLKVGFIFWCRSEFTVGLLEDGSRAIGYSVIPLIKIRPIVLATVTRRFVESALSLRHRLAAGNFELESADRPVGMDSALRV